MTRAAIGECAADHLWIAGSFPDESKGATLRANAGGALRQLVVVTAAVSPDDVRTIPHSQQCAGTLRPQHSPLGVDISSLFFRG